MPDHLSVIDNHPLIWRAGHRQQPTSRMPTQHDALDKALCGGLVQSGVVRIMCKTGIGEVSLLSAVLRACRSHKVSFFINPPGIVQAPWLATSKIPSEQIYQVAPANPKDALWAAEQCLKSGACHCVFLWASSISPKQARRLQVAATHNNALAILIMPPRCQRVSLPVSQDLLLTPCTGGLNVDVKKQAQGWPVEQIFVALMHTPTNQAIATAMSHPDQSRHDVFIAG